MSFDSLLDSSAEEFKKWLNDNDFFRIYSHLDADGISSAVIIIRLLKSLGKLFHLTIIEQLTDEVINSIPLNGPPIIFLDLGSGQLPRLNKLINNRRVLILDHHQPQAIISNPNLIHVNPCLEGINGGVEVSASGVSYLFSKRFLFIPKASSIALIGASGDLQRLDSGINSQILSESELIERKDLRIYGINTRPIHKAIEYSDLVPGVSGSETNSVNFINELGLPLKRGSDWVTISDLSSDEKQRLISGIIVKRASLPNPEDVFMSVYELELGRKRSVNEWAAVLNACGRMDLSSIGVGVLLNPEFERIVDVVLSEYKNLIADGLRWIDERLNDSNHIIQTKRVFYFIAGEEVNPRIVGTLCSIKSNEVNKDFIIGFASNNGLTKVSIRRIRDSSLLASDIAIKAAEGIGEGGGHPQAAGALIPAGSEKEFINRVEDLMQNL